MPRRWENPPPYQGDSLTGMRAWLQRLLTQLSSFLKTVISYDEDGSTVTVRGDIVLPAGATVDGVDVSELEDHEHTELVKRDGSRSFTGTVEGVTPTDAAHLATKDYVDGAGVTDHGALSGLGDVADHPDFVTRDGSRSFTGAVEGVSSAPGSISSTELATMGAVDTWRGNYTTDTTDRFSNASATVSQSIFGFVVRASTSTKGLYGVWVTASSLVATGAGALSWNFPTALTLSPDSGQVVGGGYIRLSGGSFVPLTAYYTSGDVEFIRHDTGAALSAADADGATDIRFNALIPEL